MSLTSFVPAKWGYLFEEGKYDSTVYSSTVMTLASNFEDVKSIETAGALVVAEIVRASGNMSAYLANVGHRLSIRQRKFIDEHIVELDHLLVESMSLNFEGHDFFSASTLCNTYLLRPDFDEAQAESPIQLYLRIAIHLYADDGFEAVKTAFLEMANKLYTHASPTLFNAGTKIPQGSSCFLMEVGDSLKSILGSGVYDAGLISQQKGGIGIGLGRVRHSPISNAGMSGGVNPIAKLMDDLVEYVDQGGTRKGAGTAFLPIWHIDLMRFIKSTDNFGTSQTERLHHLNTAVWMHDLFYRRAMAGETWTVFCPAKAPLFGLYGEDFEKEYLKFELLAIQREYEFERASDAYRLSRRELMSAPDDSALQQSSAELLTVKRLASRARIDHSTLDAKMILDTICDVEIKSGFPYVLNGDVINARTNQMNIGKINSSNLCVEICEVSTPDTIASCNLASVSLKAFARKPFPVGKEPFPPNASDKDIIKSIVEHGCYDFNALGDAVRSVVRNLNKIIDHNSYPCPEKTRALNFDTRPLGIGVSGFDDAVKILDLVFESREVEALNKAIFSCMYFNALVSSCQEAVIHGEYPKFRTGSFTLERAISDTVPMGATTGYMVKNMHREGPAVITEKFTGSPASNGLLQFDLWARHAGVMKSRGHLDEKVYDRGDDVPIEPAVWGQTPIYVTSCKNKNPCSCGPISWKLMRTTVRMFGLRNSLLLALMPTASTSQILRNAETTEAHSSNIYMRKVLKGNYVVASQHLISDLTKLGLWNRRTLEFLTQFGGSLKRYEQFLRDFDIMPTSDGAVSRIRHLVSKYKTMYEISQKNILKYSRQRSIYIDQSSSLNLYLTDPDVRTVRAVQTMGWKLGLKTCIYYLRQKNNDNSETFATSPEMLMYSKKVEGRSNDEVVVVVTPPIASSCPLVKYSESGGGNREECFSCGS